MKAQYYIGKILDEENNQYRVHFMKPKKENRAGCEWKWVYVDNKDGKEVHTNTRRTNILYTTHE